MQTSNDNATPMNVDQEAPDSGEKQRNTQNHQNQQNNKNKKNNGSDSASMKIKMETMDTEDMESAKRKPSTNQTNTGVVIDLTTIDTELVKELDIDEDETMKPTETEIDLPMNEIQEEEDEQMVTEEDKSEIDNLKRKHDSPHTPPGKKKANIPTDTNDETKEEKEPKKKGANANTPKGMIASALETSQRRKGSADKPYGPSIVKTPGTPVRTPVSNPYNKKKPATPTSILRTNTPTREPAKPKVGVSYSDAATPDIKALNESTIRLRFNYIPTETRGVNCKEVSTQVLEIANKIDPSAMLIQWENTKEPVPLNKKDLRTITGVELRNYVDLPQEAKRDGFKKGTIIYHVGVLITINQKPTTFLEKWNLQKKERLGAGKIFFHVQMSEIQDSPTAHFIGIVAGSTEGMETEAINNGLSKAIGVEGVRVSYQNIYQPRITAGLWQNANSKAAATKAPRNSREFQKEKYSWSPTGLAVYVIEKKNEKPARDAMIKQYGEADEDGNLPVWPGGASFRFIPMKKGRIKSERTHKIVKNRVQFHLFLKKHEKIILTAMKDINDTIDTFQGKTFQEIVLSTQSEEIEGTPLFRLFKTVWTPNPETIDWYLSVHPKLRGEATKVVEEMKERMIQQYGEEVNKFFKQESRTDKSHGRNSIDDDDDDENWFGTGSDGRNLKTRGILELGFEKAFEIDPPTSNEAHSMTDFTGSWGTPPADGYSLSSRTEGGLSTLTDLERDEKQRLTGQQSQYPVSQEEIKMRKQATELILEISYPEILRNERQLIMIASPPFHEVVPEHLQKTEFSPATMADEINKIREEMKREPKSKYTSNESTNTDKTTTSQTDQSSIDQQATPESQRENEKFKSPQGIKQQIECKSPKAADN